MAASHMWAVERYSWRLLIRNQRLIAEKSDTVPTDVDVSESPAIPESNARFWSSNSSRFNISRSRSSFNSISASLWRRAVQLSTGDVSIFMTVRENKKLEKKKKEKRRIRILDILDIFLNDFF